MLEFLVFLFDKLVMWLPTVFALVVAWMFCRWVYFAFIAGSR